jgi:hypothetical protein
MPATSNDKEQPMGQWLSSVWYATPEKINSMTKLMVFNDRGSLELLAGEMQYRGSKYDLPIRNILNVSLCRQRLPWVIYLIMNIPNIAIAVCLAVAFSYIGILAAVVIVGIFAAVVIAANLFGVLVGMSTKWIQVEYEDELGHARKAYFADGSLLGWGGILGGTSRVFHTIKELNR